MPGSEPRKIRRIVATGPESTGKSTLCAALASQYDTVWVREYAREYLMGNGMNYTYEDLLDIAKGQLAAEEAAVPEARNGFLFIDTDMYVMKVWCEFVFGRCHSFILDQIAVRRYDGYLLCDTDLPWVKDELREYPDLENRQKLFRIYKDILVNQATPWALISGTEDDRLKASISTLTSMTLPSSVY